MHSTNTCNELQQVLLTWLKSTVTVTVTVTVAVAVHANSMYTTITSEKTEPLRL